MSTPAKTRPRQKAPGFPRSTTGKRKEMMRRLRVFMDDHVWVGEHRQELLDKYAEQWIAVENQQVIANDPDLESLIAKLPDPGHTCIELITRDQVEVVL